MLGFGVPRIHAAGRLDPREVATRIQFISDMLRDTSSHLATCIWRKKCSLHPEIPYILICSKSNYYEFEQIYRK